MSGRRGRGWPGAFPSVAFTRSVTTLPAGQQADRMFSPSAGSPEGWDCPLTSVASSGRACGISPARGAPRWAGTSTGGLGRETEAERGCLGSLALPDAGPSLGFWDKKLRGGLLRQKCLSYKSPSQVSMTHPCIQQSPPERRPCAGGWEATVDTGKRPGGRLRPCGQRGDGQPRTGPESAGSGEPPDHNPSQRREPLPTEGPAGCSVAPSHCPLTPHRRWWKLCIMFLRIEKTSIEKPLAC